MKVNQSIGYEVACRLIERRGHGRIGIRVLGADIMNIPTHPPTAVDRILTTGI